MPDHLILLAPSANRVYASEAKRLVAAELKIMLGAHDHPPILSANLAGVEYLAVARDSLDEQIVWALSRLSGFYAVFQREQDRLLPIEVGTPDLFDDDLVTIPKYPGKTNEQFTRLLINVTLASMRRPTGGPVSILDPLCGRGTTLNTAMMLGCNAAGVEAELRAVEAYAAYLRTYWRRKRLKHSLELTPVRREGKIIGKRLEAEVIPVGRDRPIALTVFSGDTRQSAALFGKRRFDAVLADAPYGVVHGSQTDVRGVTWEAGPFRRRADQRCTSGLGWAAEDRRCTRLVLERDRPAPGAAPGAAGRRRLGIVGLRSVPRLRAPSRLLNPS